jgi:hypothetical protein
MILALGLIDWGLYVNLAAILNRVARLNFRINLTIADESFRYTYN